MTNNIEDFSRGSGAMRLLVLGSLAMLPLSVRSLMEGFHLGLMDEGDDAGMQVELSYDGRSFKRMLLNKRQIAVALREYADMSLDDLPSLLSIVISEGEDLESGVAGSLFDNPTHVRVRDNQIEIQADPILEVVQNYRLGKLSNDYEYHGWVLPSSLLSHAVFLGITEMSRRNGHGHSVEREIDSSLAVTAALNYYNAIQERLRYFSMFEPIIDAHTTD